MIIGLTGGIGSGKSSAGMLFRDLGIDVVDTDDLARECIAFGTPASMLLVEKFGDVILDSNEQIDRKQLRKIIFEHSHHKSFVESIIHPEVARKVNSFIASANSVYKIIIVPLLFETNSQQNYQRVLLIDSPETVQIQRASARDGVDQDSIKSIINSQLSRTEKLRLADDIICNDGNLSQLKKSVKKMNDYYLSLSYE